MLLTSEPVPQCQSGKVLWMGDFVKQRALDLFATCVFSVI